VEILDGATLRRLLLERYAENPRNWQFAISPAKRDGFFDALVSSPDHSYHVKIDSIFKPNPLMLGTKVEVDFSKTVAASPLTYGYRKLDQEVLMKILASMTGRDGSTLDSILGQLQPVVPSHIGSGSYAQGPFVFTNERIATKLSPGQAELDDRLSVELRKLLRNRYSSYG
jgi:hypothetical protein